MPTTPFGERLKRERELRGVSLEEIAKATRIKTDYLQALETEDWGRLPGGIFARGFVRTIARYLGMDEDSILAEYSIARGAPPPPTAAAPRVVKPEEPRKARARQQRNRVIFAVASAVLVIAGSLEYERIENKRHEMPSQVRAEAAPLPPSAIGASSATEEAAIVPIPKPELERPVAARTGVPDAGAANLPEYLELKIEAGKEARIRVFADHHRMYTGRISAGETRRYRARNTFEIFSSDSGAVLIELEGQTMPPLGPSGQPGRATFTRRDLEAGAGGTH